jgi:hypothetical protein
MMEVLQNEWKAYGQSKIVPLHRAYEINRLKRKLEVLTKESDDTTEQKQDLEMEINKLESETLEERNQRKEEDDRKKEEARKRKEEVDRKKEEARKRKEEEDDRKKEDARKRKEEDDDRKKEDARKRKEEEAQRKEEARKRKEEEDDRKKEDARKRREEEAQRKEEARKRKEEEDDRKKEEARKQKEEDDRKKEEQVGHARQRIKEQEEHAQQQKEEQEEQAPKARGKNKTFDDRMEDLKRYKETHGHVNVSIPEDNSLAQFCAQMRYAHNNPGKSKRKKLTIKNIARLDAIGFNWTSQEYVTRSFDERIDDLEKYKQMHGHLSVKKHEDNSIHQFCADVRYSLKKKDCTRKLPVERIARLDDLGFKW